MLASAGGGWSRDDSRWFAAVVGGGRCPVIQTLGSPAMFGGVVQSYPLEPIRAGAVGGPALGIDATVVTDEGKPVPDGAAGNLVCLQPAPAMCRSFLRDDGRYFATHFERFPGAWDEHRRIRVEADGQWFEET
jgi:acetyl-CoA synthetase